MSKSRNTSLHVSLLTELAYEVAKEHFKGDFFSFHALWSKTWKTATAFSKEKVEDWIGYFYAEILLDPRFVSFNFAKWKLKEYMPSDEVHKLRTTVFSEDSLFEEDYEKYMTVEKDKKQKDDVEIVPGEDSSIEEGLLETDEISEDEEPPFDPEV